MKRLSRRNARKWTHEVAAWLEYARVTWGIGNKRKGYVGPALKGACWIGSYILLQRLKWAGVRAGIVYDAINHHAFVRTACGWTLDPTFCQFSAAYGFRANILWTREEMPHDVGHGLAMLTPHPWRQTINRILRRMGLPEVPR